VSATVHEASWRDLPGWDRVEAGLDLAFKALSVRVVLLGLVAVTHMAPEAPGSVELFGWVRQILGVFALTATLWAAIGVGRCRAVPAVTGGRPTATAALVLVIASAAAQLVLLVGDSGGLLDVTRVASLRLLERLLLLGAVAFLLASAARAAIAARASLVGRWAVIGEAALVAFAGCYAALFLTGALADPAASGSWRTILAVALVVVIGLALYPLHRLARYLSPAPAPSGSIDDVSLHAPYRVVKVENRRRGRTIAGAEAPPAGAEGEPWIPRHERLLGLHLAPPPIPERPAWVEARDGLRLYFGGLVARVAMALVASVAPASALGGGALAWFVTLVVSIGFVAGSLAAAIGAMRYRRVPRASGTHGPAQWAGALATLLFVADALVLLLMVLAAAELVSPTVTEIPGIVAGTLVLVAPLVMAWSLAVLGRTLGEYALPRRAKRIASLVSLLGALLVGTAVLDASEASDVRGLGVVLWLAVFALAIVVTVQQLHLVHDAAESLDDHVARMDRAAEEAPPG
jgi:hypothetical protein